MRTLKYYENLSELEKDFDSKKIAILGLAEVRRKQKKMLKLKFMKMLLHSDSTNGQRGQGFLYIKIGWVKSMNSLE